MRRETLLWYTKPAQNWNEALPVGNGKLGGMVFGNPIDEWIQLNEDSVWSGGYIDRNNQSCREWLPAIRGKIREGKLQEAERFAKYAMTGTPDGERVYQTLGTLTLSYFGIRGEVSAYRRELDIERAVCTTQFTIGNAQYTREVFVSAPDHVMAVRLSAKGAKLSFHAKIGRRRFMDHVWAEGNTGIAYDGGEGIRFCCMLNACVTGGCVQTIGEYLVVEGADEAVLYLTAATSYRHENPHKTCKATLYAACQKSFAEVYHAHIEDYRALFSRSMLTLENGNDLGNAPTDERLTTFAADHSDISLCALYYNYSRYLLIASSRPGSLPANLQGIWCDSLQPPWDSKYTININTEMNYWPAEVCNLPECHLPLFALLEKMHPNGKETARIMYGVNGWVAHHNTDLWGSTAPQDTYVPATFWVMGAAWLCTHIWKHYEYTLDKSFLEKHYYLLKDACVFFLEYMLPDESGKLIISPTVSPENTYMLPDGTRGRICGGCTMDSQIVRHLFGCCAGACAALNSDSDFAERLEAAIRLTPETKIGSNGRIMEWLEEYAEPEPGHRHISHLYALFPGDEISPLKTPELACAARKTLEHRLSHGGGHTGWSRAWIINFWAHLYDAEKTQENIEQLLVKSTLPNLLDNHPPFQIDGNFGAAAGIANALLQCDGERIILLPALPKSWQKGAISALKARGGVTVDLEWDGGRLSQARLYSAATVYREVVYHSKAYRAEVLAGEVTKLTF